jgi:hypothetical protein
MIDMEDSNVFVQLGCQSVNNDSTLKTQTREYQSKSFQFSKIKYFMNRKLFILNIRKQSIQSICAFCW